MLTIMRKPVYAQAIKIGVASEQEIKDFVGSTAITFKYEEDSTEVPAHMLTVDFEETNLTNSDADVAFKDDYIVKLDGVFYVLGETYLLSHWDIVDRDPSTEESND